MSHPGRRQGSEMKSLITGLNQRQPDRNAPYDTDDTRHGLLGVLGLDEGDVVPLEHDPAELLGGVPLHVHLRRVVQHQVHVLVEAHDVALDPAHRTWT